MATIDDAFATLWKAFNSKVPLNADSAIYKEWRSQYQQWGQPIGLETTVDGTSDGTVFQVFTNAVVQWSPANGVEVITG